MERDGPWLVHTGDGYHLTVLVGDDSLDGNVDIEVTVDPGGRRWSGTLFTLDNLAVLLDRHEPAGGDSSARHIWADGMVVVRSLTPDAVVAVVEDLLRSGDYEEAFTLLEGDVSSERPGR